jgi:MmyB-like transcription regulator ligand binding domain
MPDIPAMVVNRRMDVLVWNRAAVALLTDFGALPSAERNLIRLTFLDDAFRSLYADWASAARECVAVLRMEAGRRPRAFAALVGELSVQDPDFRTWWASHLARGPRTESLRRTGYRQRGAWLLAATNVGFCCTSSPSVMPTVYEAMSPCARRYGTKRSWTGYVCASCTYISNC